MNAARPRGVSDVSAPMCHQRSPLKPLAGSLLKGFLAKKVGGLGKSLRSPGTCAPPCLVKMRQCHEYSFLPQVSSLGQAQG